MDDGEAFQQIRKGRIEGHPLRERNISGKEKGTEDKRKICEWKKDKVNVERRVSKKGSRRVVKGEQEGMRARKEYKQKGRREKA